MYVEIAVKAYASPCTPYADAVLTTEHLGSFGPLEASRGQTRQTMVGIKVVYGKLEQVGSVQRAQK